MKSLSKEGVKPAALGSSRAAKRTTGKGSRILSPIPAWAISGWERRSEAWAIGAYAPFFLPGLLVVGRQTRSLKKLQVKAWAEGRFSERETPVYKA